jgi:hypothetical protein
MRQVSRTRNQIESNGTTTVFRPVAGPATVPQANTRYYYVTLSRHVECASLLALSGAGSSLPAETNALSTEASFGRPKRQQAAALQIRSRGICQRDIAVLDSDLEIQTKSPIPLRVCVDRKPLGQPLLSEAESGTVPGFLCVLCVLSGWIPGPCPSVFIRGWTQVRNRRNRWNRWMKKAGSVDSPPFLRYVLCRENPAAHPDDSVDQ